MCYTRCTCRPDADYMLVLRWPGQFVSPGTPAERFAAATAGRRSPPGTALSSDDDDASPVIEDELDAELSASAHRVSTSSMSNGTGGLRVLG